MLTVAACTGCGQRVFLDTETSLQYESVLGDMDHSCSETAHQHAFIIPVEWRQLYSRSVVTRLRCAAPGCTEEVSREPLLTNQNPVCKYDPT